MDKLRIAEEAVFQIDRWGDKIKPKGVFNVEIHRKNGDIERFELINLVTNEGKNKFLDVMFHAIAAISTWYLGLVDNAGFTAFAAADTMASHSGWVEVTAYTEATRPAWPEDAAASQSITNTTVAQFSINATKTVKGIFLASDSTKGGTTGTLWCGTAFTTAPTLNNGDLLKVTYTVSLT